MLIRVSVLQSFGFVNLRFFSFFSGFWSGPTKLDFTHLTQRYLPYLCCCEVCCPSFATTSTKMAPISCEQKMFFREKTQENVLLSYFHHCFIEGKDVFPHLFTYLISRICNLADNNSGIICSRTGKHGSHDVSYLLVYFTISPYSKGYLYIHQKQHRH